MQPRHIYTGKHHYLTGQKQPFYIYFNHGKSPYNSLNIQVCYLIVTKHIKSLPHTFNLDLTSHADGARHWELSPGRQFPPLPDSQFLQKANMLTLSQVNQLYDTINKMSGV